MNIRVGEQWILPGRKARREKVLAAHPWCDEMTQIKVDVPRRRSRRFVVTERVGDTNIVLCDEVNQFTSRRHCAFLISDFGTRLRRAA